MPRSVAVTEQKTFGGTQFRAPDLSAFQRGTAAFLDSVNNLGGAFLEINADVQRKAAEQAEQARKVQELELQGQILKQSQVIENQNIGRPEDIRQGFEEYTEKLLASVEDPLSRARLKNQIDTQQIAATNRAINVQRQSLDAGTEVSARDGINQAVRSINTHAFDLYSPDKSARSAASAAIVSNMRTVQQSLLATKSDGSPVFSPAAIVKQMDSMKDSLFSSAARAWFESQPDKLQALNAFRTQGFSIDLGERQVSSDEGLSVEGKTALEKEFSRRIRDQITISDKVQRQADRARQKQSDALLSEFMLRDQDNQLSVADVDRARSLMSPNDYIKARKMALEDDPVNSSEVEAFLLKQASDGVDISDQIDAARFGAKSLNNDAYRRLLQVNRENAEPTKNAKTLGREHLRESLGSLQQFLDLEQGANLAQATTEYELTVGDFIEKEGRQPTRREAVAISNEIVATRRALVIEKGNKPKLLKVPVVNATPDDVDLAAKETVKSYMKIHGNDVKKMQADPAYQEQTRLLEKIMKYAKDKERLLTGE